MSEEISGEAALHVYVDPPGINAVTVHGIVFSGYFASQFSVVLGTAINRVRENGETYVETAVCARLRFDLDMAKMIRDQLDKQIALLTAPPADVKPN